jgi:hypothetical protein
VIVAPSACGSVYGIPNSIIEAPPSCIAKRIDGVSIFKRKKRPTNMFFQNSNSKVKKERLVPRSE